ncbi:MAG: heme-binding protein [Candidatus Marinimicrobia bacterium]|nr:heme-binding protein [Candidatus Neomarinimicrobiota bacterium]
MGSELETPTYQLMEKDGQFEIRLYEPMIIAMTNINSNYRESTYTGFRRIANYIFGGNGQNIEIAMTAPVISSSPVNNDGIYDVAFVMPKKNSLSNLPEPNYDNIIIKEKNLGKMAVLRFGGWATEEKVIKYQEKLEKILIENRYTITGNFMVAQYNSPWAVPPFRRNEIMVPIE